MKQAKHLLTAMLFLLLPLLGGCRNSSIDQYFSLPKPADEYLQLQQLIDNEIAAGSEYAAPTGGSYRQSIQLHDLNGDGQNEALAFLRSESRNVFVHIYQYTRSGYREVLTLGGEGSAVGSVDYADLTGDGSMELAVSWRIGTGLNMLTVYDLSGWGGNELLNTGCSTFLVCDMDSDGRGDLAAITCDGDGGTVTMYAFPANGEPVAFSSRLSRGVSELQRIRACRLQDGISALLVESFCQDGALVSDLFTSLDGVLQNVTMSRESGVSRTRRTYAVYASDIDNDQCLEIPAPSSLYTQRVGSSFWSIAWYSYDSHGGDYEKLDTYHCYSDGWYFILPDGWHSSLTVRREDGVSGERSVIFSEIDRSTGTVTDKLILYTLTGENRAERAQLDGRFIVREDESTIYAARILRELTQEDVKTRFELIYPEWITGSL